MKYKLIIQKSLILISIISFVLFVSCNQELPQPQQNSTETIPESASQDEQKTMDSPQKEGNNFYPPLDNAQSRITKKPFGLFVSPDSSPVQPERFQGYHTGTDFEVTPEELNQEIPVFAICSGGIKAKRLVNGYGGIIIQSCRLESEEIQVLYGHIDIGTHSDLQPGIHLTAGQEISILADHESEFTAQERKHLHLGIYKGGTIDLSGYVNSEKELTQWLNPEKILFVD